MTKCFKNPGPLLLWSPEPERLAPGWTQSPEEQQYGLGKGLEIVVPVDLVVISHGNFPKHLEREIIRGKKRKDFVIPKKKKRKKKTHASICEFRTQVWSIPRVPGTLFIPLRYAGLGANRWAHSQLKEFLAWGRDAKSNQTGSLFRWELGWSSPTGKHRRGSQDP